MGAVLRAWKGIGFIVKESSQDKEAQIELDNELERKIPQRFLRSWGNDYPYLNANESGKQRWLPVLENLKV